MITSDGRRFDVIKAPNAHWEYYSNFLYVGIISLCDVITSDGRRFDVIKAPNAHWEYYANFLYVRIISFY